MTISNQKMKLTEDSKCSRVLTRMKSWVNPTTFRATQLRGILMGTTATTTVGEVCAYKLLYQDIRPGHLPAYTADLMIVVMALFEALIAPFVSWWGYRRRRTLLITYTTLSTLCIVGWFFMPGYEKREESQFCDAANAANTNTFVGVTPRSAARLVIVILSCVMFVATRVACWSHGLAYSDEYAPERTSVHYGVALITRVVPMIMGYRMLTNDVDTSMARQCFGFLLGFTPNLVQLFIFMPKTVPIVKGVQKTEMPDENRNFIASVGRVSSNFFAITQIFAMGLLAAALYGFMYNELEYVKVKFNLVPDRNSTINLPEFMQFFLVGFIVAFAGNLYSQPILMKFRRADGFKQIIRSTIFVAIIYVVLTVVVSCDIGHVAGLSDDLYTNPQCSFPCGCIPRWEEFEPVCVVDEMITYVSPCHAGCGGQEFVNEIRAYANCTCSVTGRAVVGACSDLLCQQSYNLHSMLLKLLIIFTLLTFQAQGVMLLRIVDRRDKSVAMGMAWSIVAVLTFVFGHLLYLAIRVGTCRWFEANQCHLQNKSYPYHVGGTSVFLALASLVISIASAFYIRKRNKTVDDTRL